MTLSFAGATMELCAFALGLVIIHAVRDHLMVVIIILFLIATALAAAFLLAQPTSSHPLHP